MKLHCIQILFNCYHYLRPCWPRSRSPYDGKRPQSIKGTMLVFISNVVSCIVLAGYCDQNMPYHAHGFIILLTSSPTVGERFYHNTDPWCVLTGCAWMPFRVTDSDTCLHSILTRVKFAHRTWFIWQKLWIGKFIVRLPVRSFEKMHAECVSIITLTESILHSNDIFTCFRAVIHI